MLLNEAVYGAKRSAIREFSKLANKTPGCIALTLGEPDFATPQPVCGAVPEALAAGQELQEQLAGRDDLAAFLAERGYAFSDAWTKDFGAFSLRVELTEEPHASGVLRAGSILAECGDETLLELPFADYLAQEVTP